MILSWVFGLVVGFVVGFMLRRDKSISDQSPDDLRRTSEFFRRETFRWKRRALRLGWKPWRSP